MNVLPFVLALLLTLTVLTTQKLEVFKNQTTVQKNYEVFFKKEAHLVLNRVQHKQMPDEKDRRIDQIDFKVFVDKKEHEIKKDKLQAYRILLIDLMKNLYSSTQFYQEIIQKRPDFLNEIIQEMEQNTLNDTGAQIHCKADLMKIKFGDDQLQYVFYLMLKGTNTRIGIKELKEESQKNHQFLSKRLIEKNYPSLLEYIKYDKSEPTICLCPRETLQAIFGSSEIVDQLLVRRFELGHLPKDDSEKQLFAVEFKDKVRPELKEINFNFTLAKGKVDYSVYD